MLRFIFLFLFLLCFGNAHTQDSSIDFVIRNLGVNVDGHFNTFIIEAGFDEEVKLKSIASKIQVPSIETGMESRDEHILEEDYFEQHDNHRVI